MHSMHHRPGRV